MFWNLSWSGFSFGFFSNSLLNPSLSSLFVKSSNLLKLKVFDLLKIRWKNSNTFIASTLEETFVSNKSSCNCIKNIVEITTESIKLETFFFNIFEL